MSNCNCEECSKKQKYEELDKKGAKLEVVVSKDEEGCTDELSAAKVKLEGTTSNLIAAAGSAIMAISKTAEISTTVILSKVLDFCFEQESQSSQSLAMGLNEAIRGLNKVLSKSFGGNN